METLILILLAWSSPASSCKCDYSYIQKLEKNPKAADLAVVAMAVGEGKERVFKVLQAWSPYTPLVRSPDVSTCSVKTEPGQSYLLFSFNDAAFIEQRGMGFTVCDTVIKRMAEAGPYMEKLEAKEQANDMAPNPAWFYCKDTADCTLEKGICSDTVGVSKRSLTKFKNWARNRAKIVNCISSPSESTGEVKCVSSLCEAGIISGANLFQKNTVVTDPAAPSKTP